MIGKTPDWILCAMAGLAPFLLLLPLTDEQTATLLGELDRIIDGDRYPPLAAHSDAKGDPRDHQAGAGA